MSDDKCKHGSYRASAKITNTVITQLNITQLVLRVQVTCALCKASFIFKGPTGFSTTQALASPDGRELRVPLDWPLDEAEVDLDVDTGNGITH